MIGFRHVLAALITTVISVGQLEAQTGTISGRFFDPSIGAAVAGVEVTVAGRTALSGQDGRFFITDVPAGTYTLRATRLGYRAVEQSITVVAGQTTNVEIGMVIAAIELEELVAIGYGERQQRDLTGVVQEVSTEEFNTGRIVSPEELIQGKVAGVQVSEGNGGEPGGGISIRIRGGTSVNASNEPLFVVDGMPLSVGGGISAGRNPLAFLNPEDIQSMTVLKDASATAIYGSRGANGVVIIETKGGSAATDGPASQLSYTGSLSGSYVANEPDVLSAQQFRSAVVEHTGSDSLLGNANTDWRDAVQRNGFGQEHTVALAGATEDLDYRLSVGYLNQEGVIRGSATERATLGLGFRHFFFDDRLRLSANIRGARIEDNFTPGGVVGGATAFAPTQPIMDPASPHGGFFEWYNYQQALNNPVAELELTVDEGTTYRSVGNLEGQLDLPYVDGLTTNVRFGYDVTRAERETFRPSILRGEAEGATPGFISRSNSSQSNVLFDVFFNYGRTFPEALGGTEMDVTAGYSYEESNAEFPYFEARGLDFDLLGTSGVPAATEQRTTVGVDESKLISFFGRTNFTLRDRYLLTLSVRRDGSSRFGPDNEWGVFPAVALAWRLSQEPFMQGIASISDLKLRASWGKNGNQAIGNYEQFPAYNIGEPTAQYQFGDEFITTIRPGAADEDIKWEETTSYNLGLDFGFASNRFTGAIDYYFKETDDLLFEVPVAAGTFTTNFITTNIGSVENRGLELSLSALIADGGDQGDGFSWTADFNAATNSNEIVSINPRGGQEVILTGGIAGAVGNFIQVLQPGQPINAFYVFEHRRDSNGRPIYADNDGDGFIDDDELLDMYVDQPTVCDSLGRNCEPDGIINQDDRIPFESPAPDWILGHTSRMTWKKFDASFTVRAHLGNYVYNNVASNYGHYRALSYVGPPNNLHASVLDTGFESEQYFSDYYVEDASFLRMDNLTLGYTFSPLRGGQRMRLFGTIQNVFMLTGYDGVDPLAGVNGIDNNLYPRSRTFTAGVSVWF